MGILRHPRVRISTNGGSFAPKECSVHVSQHQSSDTFSACLALDLPSASFWLDTAPIDVKIEATNDYVTGSWVTMLTGQVDEVTADLQNRTVKISGRDKTAQMTDKKTTEKWQNRKPEEIIKDLAGRSGLGVQFGGSSKDKAGLKFKDDYNRISEYDSHWNVITRMAKHIGCIAFVKGDTLYVQPYDQSSGGVFTVRYVPPSPFSPARSNVTSFTSTRNLHLSKNVKVNHKSWRHKEGEAIESEYKSTGGGDGDLEYTFKGANLTKQQQDQLAETKLNEILSHERTASISTYGDVNLDPQMKLQIMGTGTGVDQSYIISSIEHRWDEEGGYVMDVEVRNKDSKRSSAQQVK